jgi:hypothetical protein
MTGRAAAWLPVMIRLTALGCWLPVRRETS